METLPQKVQENKPPLIQVSEALFKSGLFPNVRNSYGAFAIVEYGHELGIGPMTSLQTMAIVSGKICMAAQMMLALAVKAGVNYKIIVSTNEKAEIQFKGDTEYVSAFSIEDAKKAGIYKAQSGWEKYPKNMCFWRAVTQGIRVVKPGVVLGLYAIEELQDAPAIDSDVKEEPPAQDKTRNFKWLERMAKAKTELGNEEYYGILTGRWGYEHSNLVIEPKEQDEIISEMIARFKEISNGKQAT